MKIDLALQHAVFVKPWSLMRVTEGSPASVCFCRVCEATLGQTNLEGVFPGQTSIHVLAGRANKQLPTTGLKHEIR